MEPARSTLYRTFLLGAVPVLFVLGLGLGVPSLLAPAAAWLTILAAGWMSSRRRLRGLDVRRVLYPNAFEGDAVDIALVLETTRRTGMVELTDVFGPSLADEHRMLEPGPLHAGESRRLSYVGWCSRQWGIYPVGPVGLLAADSAGLFRAWRRLPSADAFAVFPRVYDVRGLVERGARASLAPQEATTGRPGRSLLYLGVREYRAGDDLRHVHWPASARRGSLVVKEYELDLAPHVTVFADLERRNRAGTGKKSTLEYVLRTAASIVWSAGLAGHTVQVIGEGERPLRVPPGRGETHVTFALYELLRVVQDGGTPVTRVALERVLDVPERSTAVLVSGTLFLDLGETEELLEIYRGRSVRPVAVLVDSFSFPAIHGWPPPKAEVVERRREVEFFLRSRGVPLLVLEAAEDLEAALGRGGFGA